MAKREAKQYKALYFDLRIHDLETFYPKKNHLGAYTDIKNYLLSHAFAHHSVEKMTDLEIFDLVHDMALQMPWFSKCINHFAVTNIGTNYNLLDILEPVELEPVLEPEMATATG